MYKNLDLFCSIFSRETGITFTPAKYSFVMNRLEALLKKYNCISIAELITAWKTNPKIKIDVLNALTTNETWFFRHPEHFNILKQKVLPSLVKNKKGKSISIWSAGCSVGAELYSILITLLETVPDLSNLRFEILGSDISYDVVQVARKGLYDRRYLRATDPEIISKYFIRLDDETYEIKPELRQYVKFEYMNLQNTWPPRKFDIIFCRNTMIYFGEENKKTLIKKIFKALETGGYFFTSINELIDLVYKDFGIKKIFLGKDYIYKKINLEPSVCDIYFKSPSDLLRASNCLRKNSFHFQFGLDTTSSNGSKLRYIKINSEDYQKVASILDFNSIKYLSNTKNNQ